MINTTMSPESKADGRLVTLSKRQLDPILQELYEVKAQLNAEAGGNFAKRNEVSSKVAGANKTA